MHELRGHVCVNSVYYTVFIDQNQPILSHF